MDPGAHGSADGWLTPRRFAGVLALLVVATFPEVVFGLQSFVHRDFGLFGHPLAHYHRECFWRGELPLWNPYNNFGLPFLAQWNTLTLYPGSLIYLLFPLPWSLNIFCLAHLVWAGVGMFWLAERWTGHRTAAAVAGVAFAFSGLMLNALMWPNNIAALGWMPWVVGWAESAWRNGGRSLPAAALVATLQMLTGSPEIILFTWIILATFWAASWLKASQPRTILLGRFLGLVALVVMLGAAQLFPFLDLLRHSHRDAGFATGDWSMPLWGWLNFLVPQFHVIRAGSGLLYQPEQFWTSSYYAGGAVFALAVGATARWRQPRVLLLTSLLLAALVLALGDGGKIYRWIREIVPAVNFMRFPIKFVVVAMFILPLLAAVAVAEWDRRGREDNPTPARGFRRLAIGLLALCAGTVVWARFQPLGEGDWERTAWSAARSALCLVMIPALLELRTKARLRLAGPAGLALLMILLWLDARTHAPNQNPTVPPAVLKMDSAQAPRVVLGDGRALLSLAAMDFFYRTNTADAGESYRLRRRALQQNVNLIARQPKVDGFYSLYLPEERRVHFRLYRSEQDIREGLADFIGVTAVSSRTNLLDWSPRTRAMAWATGGQQPVFTDAATALTKLIAPDFDPRRTVLLPLEARSPAVAKKFGPVSVLKSDWSAERVRVETDSPGPGWLVIAQAHYHPWRALVDEAPAPIRRANVAFQAVELPPGRHTVELTYRDDAFRLGCAVSLAGLALVGVWWRKRGRSQPEWLAGE